MFINNFSLFFSNLLFSFQKNKEHIFMKSLSKKTLFLYKERLVKFVNTFGFYTIKTQKLSVSYFSQTKYYVFYVLFVILPFFPKMENNSYSFLCKFLVFFLIISTFLLFVLLNLSFTNKRVARLVI